MSEFALLIGYRHVSSWSLRGWLMMRKTGAPFEEVLIRYRLPEHKARLTAINPAAKQIECQFSKVDLAEVMNVGGFNLKRVLEFEPDFLDESDGHDHEHDSSVSSEGHGHEHDHDHDHRGDHDAHGHEHDSAGSRGHDHKHDSSVREGGKRKTKRKS